MYILGQELAKNKYLPAKKYYEKHSKWSILQITHYKVRKKSGKTLIFNRIYILVNTNNTFYNVKIIFLSLHYPQNSAKNGIL